MTEVLRCFSRVDLVGMAPSVVRNDCTVTPIAPTPPNHATSGQEVAHARRSEANFVISMI